MGTGLRIQLFDNRAFDARCKKDKTLPNLALSPFFKIPRFYTFENFRVHVCSLSFCAQPLGVLWKRREPGSKEKWKDSPSFPTAFLPLEVQY